jgi:uncharacterized protein
MDFEWDAAKAESNERKHGVSFDEAMTLFADPLSLTGYDPKHADEEDRFLTMGASVDGRLLVVSHSDRGDSIRIIRARVATRRERKDLRMATSPDDVDPSDDLQSEYDFRSLRGVVRGKYATRYRERLRVVRLAEDLSGAFADEAAVNAALREYLAWRKERPAANPA